MIRSQVTQCLENNPIPWMLMRSILLHMAKEKGHRVHEMVVSSAVEHIFERDSNTRKSTGKQSSGKGKQSKSWSKSEGKGKSEEIKGKSKGKSKGSKGAKGSYKAKTSKTGLSGLANPKSETISQKFWNLHRRITLTILTRTIPGEMMAEVLMNGMITGVLSDGTKVGNKRVTLLEAHFRLEVWILVPREVQSGLNG